MNMYKLPEIYGIAIDGERTKKFDDIFWVHRKGTEYTFFVCVPSISQRDTRTSPVYHKGFVPNQRIPAICFEFKIKSHHNTVGLQSFRMYECWAKSIANVHERARLQSLSEDIRTMLANTQSLVLALKHMFQKSGAMFFSDRWKELPELSNTHFLMTFVNMVVANFAVLHQIPLLYYDLGRKEVFECNIGMMKLLPHYAHVTSPLRRIADVVNQCNLMAYFKGLPYPLDQEDLAGFDFGSEHSLSPIALKRGRREIKPMQQIVEMPIIEIVKVVGERYSTALDATYRMAQKPLPVYSYDSMGKKRVQCTITVVDLVDGKPFSRSSVAGRKEEALLLASRKLYEFLTKRYEQSEEKTKQKRAV